MTDLVVWQGPVYDGQVPGATIAEAERRFIPCVGDGIRTGRPHCPAFGDQIRGGGMPALLSKAGSKLSPSEVDDLYLAGFSAGGSTIKRLLEEQAFRDRTTGVYLADATYTSRWVDKKGRKPPPIEGFVAYAVDVANGPGDKLFVATASPIPNGQWATGAENLVAMMEEVEKRTGKTFVERADFFGVDPGPEKVYQLGNVIFAPYPMKPVGHGHTSIATQVFEKIFQPWVDKGKGPIDGPALGPAKPGPTPQPPGGGPSPSPPDATPLSAAAKAGAVAAGVIGGLAAVWLVDKSG